MRARARERKWWTFGTRGGEATPTGVGRSLTIRTPVDPANPCRCGRQIASGEAAGILDRRQLPLARHSRKEARAWVEPVAKQLDMVAAIGDLYRFDRFAAPAQLWDDLQERFPELLNAA